MAKSNRWISGANAVAFIIKRADLESIQKSQSSQCVSGRNSPSCRELIATVLGHTRAHKNREAQLTGSPKEHERQEAEADGLTAGA